MLELGRKNIFRDKRTRNKVPSMFFDVIVCLQNENYCINGLCQKTSKGTVYVYLALENFKIRSKKGQQ